jgi:hypothetical protein
VECPPFYYLLSLLNKHSGKVRRGQIVQYRSNLIPLKAHPSLDLLIVKLVMVLNNKMNKRVPLNNLKIHILISFTDNTKIKERTIKSIVQLHFHNFLMVLVNLR